MLATHISDLDLGNSLFFSATMCLKLQAYPHDARHLLSGEVNIGLAGDTAETEKRGDCQDDVAASE